MLVLKAIFLVTLSQSPSPGGILSLQDYLSQVRAQSFQVERSSLQQQRAELQVSSTRLRFQPSFIGGVSYRNSKESGFFSFVNQGDELENLRFDLGVSKQWSTGTLSTISMAWSQFDVEGNPAFSSAIWQNQLFIRLEQSLWKNGWGREISNTQKKEQLELEAVSTQARFQQQVELVNAESAYWNYAFSRLTTKTLESSLKRAEGILEWNRKRLDLKIIDQGDFLQSEARVLNLQQQLEETRRREREARREFFFYLNREFSNEPQSFELEALQFDPTSAKVVEEWGSSQRLDLAALQKLREAARAESIAIRSSLDPDVKLIASYEGDSADSSFGSAARDSLNNSFRKYQVGVQLQVPLGFGWLKDSKQAAQLRAKEKEIEYSQTRFELEKRFTNLRQQINDLKSRISLAERLTATEQKKLDNEQKRFRQGRSTSFQVLSFEEDLAQAELSLLGLYAQLRLALAQMRLFAGGF